MAEQSGIIIQISPEIRVILETGLKAAWWAGAQTGGVCVALGLIVAYLLFHREAPK